MAPLPSTTLTAYLTNLLKRTSSTTSSALSPRSINVLSRSKNLLPRDGPIANPGVGVTPPQSINNQAIFGLFGLIGVGFVITGIWFFFFAKNGGFYFKENDWEDYKSTVLRRKGPNGTTLSGATESTDLGGGSVVHGDGGGKRSIWGGRKLRKIKKKQAGKVGGKRYKDFEDEESTVGSEISGTTLTTEMTELPTRAQPKKSKLHQSIENDDGDIADEETRLAHDDDVRAYRHEKPARVGGINKHPDGSSWDGSTDAASSVLLANRERTPTTTPTKKRERKERHDNYTGGSGTGGIRKVVSVSANADPDRERERVKAEAAKLQEKGRAAQRRDFSFKMGDDVSSTSGSGTAESASRREQRRTGSPSKKVPGSYVDEVGSAMGSDLSSDLGTKSYHHTIPGLSGSGVGGRGAGGDGSDSGVSGSGYTEERREERRRRREEGRGAQGRYRRGEN